MNELILIVEDEKDTAELLDYNLQKEGYRTVTAENGVDAITTLQAKNPDLMLLDILLPGLNGWEVCSALRSKGVPIPIVMLTALSTKDEQVKGLSIGADDYVTKPFSIKELMLRIRKLLEKEKTIKTLETREKEEAESLKYLVHELGNSIMKIGAFSGLATEKGKDDKYLSIIKSSAKYMESILNDASLLPRLEKGERLLPTELVDLEEQLAWAVGAISTGAERNWIDIHLLSDFYGKVQGNITGIRQVFINLLSNAIRYNRKLGKIWIYSKETEDHIEIFIKDTGYGISEEELPKIFQKFYRAKSSEKEKGTGLGLYLVKLLMESMGGKVRATSKEGVGSTFTVSFKK